ncbi:multi antimicrobial extrusion protein MatE [Pseudalkalibacillus salsuginis]|uniref:multi antimicrobial extrusion protein MatE n=1 Tax=Pseudalkalibacillus salsuginis TaxID=2910972 RepID=UPI001F234B79|nr:multi antimicrobial extrusion protein MatE [Pseudalkalibacillus salsuginis]MCF6408435.1 multi antimicrobial extrusion protein MatE [Pseudalkalibacillus salsuginis]
MKSDVNDQYSYKQLAAFFIPLGFSASLTSITHVIINGTLSRGENAAFIIACYAVAFSLFGIIERPIIVFRQTCSALVKDRRSFQLLSAFLVLVMSLVIGFSMLMAFSRFGDWVYINLFNANANMVSTISLTFKVIAFVIIFSGIRGLYQGVIIKHLETKWLTIGVIVRLCAMLITAYLFVVFDYVTSVSGAIIFLTGMLIECIISVWKGHEILKQHFRRKVSELQKIEISNFYFPLVFYFIIQTILVPIIYVFLANSEDIELSIASFALAYSITQMMLSFFMYTHQLVLQMYQKNRLKVIRFMVIVSILPTLLLVILCYTPTGMWFMAEVMGAEDDLAIATLTVLKFFIIKTIVFPWVDFLNGYLMLYRKTRRMLIAQVVNILTAIFILWLLVSKFPDWNGINGSIAASIGELAGFGLILFIVIRICRESRQVEDKMRTG